MSIQGFYSGVSGLKAFQTAIDVTANNIANVSTVGFRGYNTEFASVFEDTIKTGASGTTTGNGSNTLGLGVQAATASMNKTAGSIIISDKSTDLAIVGNGWFGVQNGKDVAYTRAGDFTFDRDSDLVTANGNYVLGTVGGNISEAGILTNVLDEVKLGDVEGQEKLRFPKTLTYPSIPSSNTKFVGNLGTEDLPRTIGASVIDSNNNKNHLKLAFTKSIPQVLPGTQWDVVATTQSLDGTTLYDTKNGVVSFDSAGALISSTLTSINNNGTQVTIDLGSGYDGVTSLSNVPISASSITDGSQGGSLVGYSVNKNAEIIATFDNGLQSSVGKIAVYHFRNEQGLTRSSGATFSASANSGKPLFFKDSTGQSVIGTDIINFSLEASNVGLEVALTDLIILQRAYDANSKSISTADQMMQKALSMDA